MAKRIKYFKLIILNMKLKRVPLAKRIVTRKIQGNGMKTLTEASILVKNEERFVVSQYSEKVLDNAIQNKKPLIFDMDISLAGMRGRKRIVK